MLYELGIPDENLLKEYGLTLVYVQDGTFLNRPSFTFVAVRDDLVEPLGLHDVRVVKYGSQNGKVTVQQTQRLRESPIPKSPAAESTGSSLFPQEALPEAEALEDRTKGS